MSKKICIVIGDPVGHSLSPVLHNAGYEKLGIDNEFSYEARQIKPEKLEDFINSLRFSNIQGVSVTKPHKENVIPLLDKISDEAKAIGAVNTILVEDRELIGHNTDWLGATLSLEKLVGLKDKKVVLIGAGGTAKALAYSLSRADCEVTILNRTEEKASLVASKYGFKSGLLNNNDAILNAEIICN
ncbi:MAG TPA: NAD(P)-binding domain-containing protein, partial [Patescibacteria group bacterium]|nr:NAD(P)-binding domain-containing protein [Patescibacteria group bacterium]